MLLSHGNLFAKVQVATEDEQEWLREFLAIPDAKARFRGSRGDGRIHLFNEVNASFPAGFLPVVKKHAKEAGIEVGLVDKRKTPLEGDPGADLAWLRPYQQGAVDAVVKRGRGILWMATGAGKTEVAAALVRRLPRRWLFLVHRTTLAEQAAERFDRRNREHGVDLGPAGVIGEGRWTEGEHLTCATFQTIAHGLDKGDPRTRELLEGTDGVIVDESHVLPAGSFYRVAMATPRAYYRVGLSGTPLARTDKRSALAIGALGPVIYRISAEQLVAEGVLARPKVRMVTVTQSALGGTTWQGVYGNGVVRSTKRNDVLASIVQRAEKPCLLFVKELRHGRELEKRLSAMGLHVDFTHGQHSTDWRRTMVKSLVAGRLDVVICTVVFQEGVDIPELRSVVIGSGGESVIAALQRVGRGTRKTADKDEFEVWDIADRGNKWLEKHARARQHAYAAESFETIVEPESPAALVAARVARTERSGE